MPLLILRNLTLFLVTILFALVISVITADLLANWFSYSKKPSLSLLKIKRKERVLFFSPHPDDETLAAGGLISQLLAQKNPLKIVFITRGNANPSLLLKDKKFRFLPEKFIETGRVREKEAKKAIKALGGQENNLLFWDYPDGALSSLWENPKKLITSQTTKLDHSPDTLQEYRGENLTKDIKDIIEEFQPTVIFAPHQKESNPDHQAVTLFIKKALKAIQWQGTFYQYPIHLKILKFFRVYPPGLKKKNKILFPPRQTSPKGEGWFSFWLSEEQLAKKRKALNCYQSQLIIPTLRALFRSFQAQNEIFSLLNYSSSSSSKR